MNVPVFLLGASPRPVLGLTVSQYARIAARRAGLPVVDELPASGDVIVVHPDAVITAAALTALAGARAGDAAIADRADLIARVDASRIGDAVTHATSQPGNGSLAALLRDQPVERIDVPVVRFAGPGDRVRAEKLLVRSACKTLYAGDYLGVFNRDLTIPLVRLVARTSMTPNAITVVSFLFTIAAAGPLATGGYLPLLAGAFLQWCGSLLDSVDGKLARLKGQTSVLGAKLDTWLDMVYYAVLFAALGIGASRDHAPVLVATLAGVTMTGMLASFVVIAGMRRKLVPRDRPEQFGPLVYRLLDQHRADPGIGFARLTIRVTTRAGMPHLLLAAALIGVLPVALPLAALAANLVWILGLRLERLALGSMEGARDAA